MNIAIVTGASSGMGREFALQLSQYVKVDEIWAIARREEALKSINAAVPIRPILGAGMITGLELLTGWLVNQDHKVWDYRDQLFQFQGQICLAFSLLWVPVSLMAMELYTIAQKKLAQKIT